MAVTATVEEASAAVQGYVRLALSGDETSPSVQRTLSWLSTLDAIGVASGDVIATDAGVEVDIAHATDPAGAAGSFGPSQGFVPDGDKLIAMLFYNRDDTEPADVFVSAANGLAGFPWAAGDLIAPLPPEGGSYLDLRGLQTVALSPGVNDGIKIQARNAAATPVVAVMFVFGAP